MSTRRQTNPSICLTQYEDVCVQLSTAVCFISRRRKESVDSPNSPSRHIWSVEFNRRNTNWPYFLYILCDTNYRADHALKGELLLKAQHLLTS